MKKLANWIVLVALTTFAFTATAGELKGEAPAPPAKMAVMAGVITDAATGEALAGALVEVEGAQIKTFTDLEGKYVIPQIETGVYKLKVTYISYLDRMIPSVKVEGRDNSLDIQLQSK